MKANNINVLFVLFVVFVRPFSLEACTTFVLKRNNTILLAKNLDWPIADGVILVNKRGETKTSFSADNESFYWQARYGSITFNQFGKEFPLGGINEKGLVVEELNYSPSQYPVAQHNRVNEFQWIQYQLDNFSTVSQVIENIETITIVPVISKLHYMICDHEGHVAIIEFTDGHIQYTLDNDVIIPVLTNNSYSNSLKYAKHHKGFGGSRIVSDGPESPERFVRAATLLNAINTKNNEPLHDDAFYILNAVSQDDTQWSIVYDIGARSITFKTKQNSTLQKISLCDFDFLGTSKMFNLSFNLPENQIPQFQNYSARENLELIDGVLEKLIRLDELSREKARELFESFEHYYQTVH